MFIDRWMSLINLVLLNLTPFSPIFPIVDPSRPNFLVHIQPYNFALSPVSRPILSSSTEREKEKERGGGRVWGRVERKLTTFLFYPTITYYLWPIEKWFGYRRRGPVYRSDVKGQKDSNPNRYVDVGLVTLDSHSLHTMKDWTVYFFLKVRERGRRWPTSKSRTEISVYNLNFSVSYISRTRLSGELPLEG